MNKLNLILVDYDENYLNYLNNFLVGTYKGKFEISCFTNCEMLISMSENIRKKDILIINKEMDNESINDLGFSAVLYLVESDSDLDYGNGKAVHKFKEVKSIPEKAVAAYLEGNPNQIKKVYDNNSETKIITVYSPIGGSGKSLISAALSVELAKREKEILYLNLEDIQSTPIYFSGDGKTSFSDIILEVKDRSENFIQKLVTKVNKDKKNNVYYLDPTENILDIEDIDEEDIKWMLEAILKANKYDYVIIDTVSKYNSIYNVVLNSSEHIITPILCGNETANNKLAKLLSDVESLSKYFFVFNRFNEREDVPETPECLEKIDKTVQIVIREDRGIKMSTGRDAIFNPEINSRINTIINTLNL